MSILLFQEDEPFRDNFHLKKLTLGKRKGIYKSQITNKIQISITINL